MFARALPVQFPFLRFHPFLYGGLSTPFGLGGNVTLRAVFRRNPEVHFRVIGQCCSSPSSRLARRDALVALVWFTVRAFVGFPTCIVRIRISASIPSLSARSLSCLRSVRTFGFCFSASFFLSFAGGRFEISFALLYHARRRRRWCSTLYFRRLPFLRSRPAIRDGPFLSVQTCLPPPFAFLTLLGALALSMVPFCTHLVSICLF